MILKSYLYQAISFLLANDPETIPGIHVLITNGPEIIPDNILDFDRSSKLDIAYLTIYK